MGLSFGVTVLPDPPYSRFLELIQLAESNGFEYGWTYDSHVLWQESFPLLTLAVQATSTMKFGHCVTNPGTREPTVLASGYATLHDISNGRMVMGIGRGDSAVRYIGEKPVRVAEFERRCADDQGVHERSRGRLEREAAASSQWVRPGAPGDPDVGRRLRAEGARRRWTRRRRRHHPARRSGDHPVDHGHRSRVPPPRRDAIRRSSSASSARPSHITDDIADAREQVRWFPAMVSNHVMDLIERYGYESEIPHELTEYVRVRKFYDYDEHSRVGAKHGEFVTDEICDRFCVLGTPSRRPRS